MSPPSEEQEKHQRCISAPTQTPQPSRPRPESLRAVDQRISEPMEERLGDSKRWLFKLARDIKPYRSFVPVLEENLDAMAPWLEART